MVRCFQRANDFGSVLVGRCLGVDVFDRLVLVGLLVEFIKKMRKNALVTCFSMGRRQQ